MMKIILIMGRLQIHLLLRLLRILLSASYCERRWNLFSGNVKDDRSMLSMQSFYHSTATKTCLIPGTVKDGTRQVNLYLRLCMNICVAMQIYL